MTLLVAATAVVAVTGASAKDFEPGDLRLCGVRDCTPLMNAMALGRLSAFYYGRTQPTVASKARLGAPYFVLRFRNGYATGIVAGAKLDRFLSYGVNLGHFKRGTWYALPASAAHELRRLAGTRITPLFLTRAAVAKSR
jgi:hypothetical protein